MAPCLGRSAELSKSPSVDEMADSTHSRILSAVFEVRRTPMCAVGFRTRNKGKGSQLASESANEGDRARSPPHLGGIRSHTSSTLSAATFRLASWTGSCGAITGLSFNERIVRSEPRNIVNSVVASRRRTLSVGVRPCCLQIRQTSSLVRSRVPCLQRRRKERAEILRPDRFGLLHWPRLQIF